MPKRNTIFRWKKSYPDFGEAYTLALEQHVDALVDEAGEIVDTERNPQLAKVRADHRRWIASRLCRNKWGDKLEIHQHATLDISDALQAAIKRMRSVCVGTVIDVPSKQLESDENINKVT